VQADQITFETPLVQTEPIIVLPYGTINILIDGYFCATLFMRSPNPDAEILVWFPLLAGPQKTISDCRIKIIVSPRRFSRRALCDCARLLYDTCCTNGF